MQPSFNTTDYAIYLPAVSAGYAQAFLKPLPGGRLFPENLALDDLAFWDRKNRLFYHPYVLHSVGQYTVGQVIDNALTRGGRTDRVLIGDSGGFQVGKGTLKGYKELRRGMTAQAAEMAWLEADHVRDWIISWLETNCQYSMTLDMPLWATTNSGVDSPFHQCSIEQLTQMTVENLKFIDLHRQGKTKWLNVIQGIDEDSINSWYQAVKWFQHGGWAFAGAAGVFGGLKNFLKTVLMMRDDDAFSVGQDWLHVLGTSKIQWAIMLTAVQKCLKKSNPKLKISFDSSSPFQKSGLIEEACYLPDLQDDIYSWKVRSVKSPQGYTYVGSSEPFPFASPLGDQMTLGHLNVYKKLYNKRRYDPVSLTMLINHNLYIYLQAFELANDQAFSRDPDRLVPQLFKDCINLIFEAFDKPNWNSVLENNSSLLNAHSVSAYE
jgi:hypothetical protein